MTPVDGGKLYVVATPIGHLQDITLRALEILKNVDWIAAEDTRHTRVLLQRHGIERPLISLHAHNERQRLKPLIARLRQGEQGALVSDAGTPLISDPGAMLVAAARAAGIPVSPVPGPSALIAALSASGLPAHRFAFEGFPPARPGARRQWLAERYPMPYTQIFYEAPHRLLETLDDMIALWGAAHPCVVARELTKPFEQFVGETLAAVRAYFTDHPDQVRGELVMLLGPVEVTEDALSERERQLIASLLEAGLSEKTVVQSLAQSLALRPNAIKRHIRLLKSMQQPS